ncbi:MAG: hypothetical protein Q8K86_11520 [Candidatus Nanopelagicaceae bacterium]|nr:hypothetical protein [Candidatus Nanopelagicaceae bacterium]
MRILIFKEKHDTRYFSAANPKAIKKASLKILGERLKEGWFDVDDAPKPPELQINFIPKSAVNTRERLKTEHADYQERLRQHNEDVRFLELAKKAIKKKDGSSAWDLLRLRKDCEYERMSVVELEEA